MPVVKLTKAVIEKATVPERAASFLWDQSLKGYGLVLHAPSARHPHGSRVFVVRYRTRAGKDRRQVLGAFGELTQEQARAMAADVLAEVRRGGDPMAERREIRAARERIETRRSPTVFERLARLARAARQVEGVHRRRHPAHVRVRRDPDHRQGADRGGIAARRAARARSEGRRAVSAEPHANVDRGSTALGRTGRAATCGPESLRHDRAQPGEDPRARAHRSTSWRDSAPASAGSRPITRTAVDVLRFLAITGLRKREATRLRWAEVDLQPLRCDWPTTKTGARVKLLAEPALAILRNRAEAVEKAAEKGTARSEWVFPSERKRTVPIEDLRDVIADARVGEDGNEVAAFSAHTLRHGFATVATKARLNPLIVALMLGHRKRGVTEGYIHVDPDDALVREAEERVQGLIARALAGASAQVIELDTRRGA